MTKFQAIGRRVKKLRESARPKETQDGLAAAVGVGRSTIGMIETGKDGGGIDTMIAIADHYKVPLDWLVCRRVPAGGPLAGQFVDDPNELAWLDFWRGIPEQDRDALFRALQIRSPGDSRTA